MKIENFIILASGRRIEQLNVLLCEELAKIVDRELEFPEGALVTLTRVEITDDKLYASVYFSVMGGDPKEVLEIFGKDIYNIQQILNKKLRMRPVPKIRFVPDQGEENREKVERAVAELKRKGEL